MIVEIFLTYLAICNYIWYWSRKFNFIFRSKNLLYFVSFALHLHRCLVYKTSLDEFWAERNISKQLHSWWHQASVNPSAPKTNQASTILWWKQYENFPFLHKHINRFSLKFSTLNNCLGNRRINYFDKWDLHNFLLSLFIFVHIFQPWE